MERLKAMRILVIDDTKTTLMLIKLSLEKMGHDVVTSQQSKDAIPLYHEHQPDLVILDVVMEGDNGFDCAKKIRKLNNGVGWVPIIFLSARVTDEDIHAGIEAGGDDYLTKPYSDITLEAKIKAMQRIAEMRSELIETSGQLKKANKQLQELATVDSLTGIRNRRYLDQYLNLEWSRTSRLPKDLQFLPILMADIDFFKAYNDHYGHQGGDDCLCKVAQALESCCNRSADLVARFGGEEFCIILPNTDYEVRSLDITHEKSTIASNLTISIGAAFVKFDKSLPPKKLIQYADEALYQAKEAGRNRAFIVTIDDDEKQITTIE